MAKAKKKPAAEPATRPAKPPKKVAKVDPHDLEELVRQFISESGLAMRAIHEQSGVAPAQLSRFMRGERTLTLKTAGQLAKAFGFTITREA